MHLWNDVIGFRRLGRGNRVGAERRTTADALRHDRPQREGVLLRPVGNDRPVDDIRVAFPTQDNNDNAYFEAVSTPGPHTVLFSDTAQGSWVTSKSAFEPTKVMLLQFQIPSSTTAPVPWNFCVEGLTAVTN